MACIWIDSQNQIIKDGLARLLCDVGHTRSACSAEPEHADLVLRDLQNRRAPYPLPTSSPTLALVSHENEEIAFLLRLGYKGYLRPEDTSEKMAAALDALLRGEVWAERHIIAQALEQRAPEPLTHREQQVYQLITRGFSNRKISERLGIAVKTVKVYNSSLYSKLGVKGRTDIILNARNRSQKKS